MKKIIVKEITPKGGEVDLKNPLDHFVWFHIPDYEGREYFINDLQKAVNYIQEETIKSKQN